MGRVVEKTQKPNIGGISAIFLDLMNLWHFPSVL
jgi:hypothetical protein